MFIAARFGEAECFQAEDRKDARHQVEQQSANDSPAKCYEEQGCVRLVATIIKISAISPGADGDAGHLDLAFRGIKRKSYARSDFQNAGNAFKHVSARCGFDD